MVDVKDNETSDDEHNKEGDHLDSYFSLLFQRENGILDEQIITLDRFWSCNLLSLIIHFNLVRIFFIRHTYWHSYWHLFNVLFIDIYNLHSTLFCSIVDILVNWHTMVILGRSLSRYLVATKVKLEVQMCEHFFVFHASVRPHLFDLSLILEGLLKLFEQFADGRFVLGLPFDLARLFLAHGFVKHA